MIRKLFKAIKRRIMCKRHHYYCPDCIYHEWIWEGAVFRGNRCRYMRGKE